MPASVRRFQFAIIFGCLPVAVAGCHIAGLIGAGQASPKIPSITVGESVRASSLTVIAGGADDAAAISAIVRDTARPSEFLDILAAGRPARVVIASVSPPPARITVAGRPARPPAGSSSFQWSKYRGEVTAWRTRLTAARRQVASMTGTRVARWLGSRRILDDLDGLPPADVRTRSLGAECADGADAMAGLRPSAETRGPHVLVLFVSSLAGSIPMGELNGDAVIVVSTYLPTASAAAAAQIRMVGAGALRATILGPEMPTAQLARLITAGQTLTTRTKVFPDSALFRNGSATLLPAARRELRTLVPLLRTPGATAVINGYASTTGTRRQNYLLSYSRADAVATFLEERGVQSAAITVVGHGAIGPSPRDRRVAVVIERS